MKIKKNNRVHNNKEITLGRTHLAVICAVVANDRKIESEEKQDIYKGFVRTKPIQTSQLCEKLNLSSSTNLNKYIRDLRKTGFIKQVGEHKDTAYVLGGDLGTENFQRKIITPFGGILERSCAVDKKVSNLEFLAKGKGQNIIELAKIPLWEYKLLHNRLVGVKVPKEELSTVLDRCAKFIRDEWEPKPPGPLNKFDCDAEFCILELNPILLSKRVRKKEQIIAETYLRLLRNKSWKVSLPPPSEESI